MLEPSDQQLQAANGTTIVVRGEATLPLQVGPLTVPTKCLVVDGVTEVLIGMGWLLKNVDCLDFKNRRIRMRGHSFRLESEPLNRVKEPGRTGIEEWPRPVRKRRPPERLNDCVRRSRVKRSTEVDIGSLEDALSMETDDGRMFERRETPRSEEVLVHSRCGGNETDPAADQ